MLIENFRPGSLAELGFDYATVAAMNPRLIYCSISGYGQTGPSSQLPGYDAVLQGEAGIMDMTGFQDGEPTRVGVAITDYLAGLYATQGILLALNERHTSGLGQHVDISLFEAMLSVMRLPMSVLLATGAVPEPRRQRSPQHRALPAAAREGRPDHRRRRQPGAVDPVLRGDGPSASGATIRGSQTNTDRVANRAALKEAIEAACSRASPSTS